MGKVRWYCCVPLCRNDDRYRYNEKSFHSFPVDSFRRKQWAIAVGRDPDFQIKPNAKVCSAHFKATEFKRTLAGKRCLVKDAVPSIFSWTKDVPTLKLMAKCWTTPDKSERRDNIHELKTHVARPTSVPNADHDCLSISKEKSTEEKLRDAKAYIEKLEKQLTTLSLPKFCVVRFSHDPQMIEFYTGFESYSLFHQVFEEVKPSAEKMTLWTQMQTQGCDTNENVFTETSFDLESLSLLDQFFLFLVKLRLGLFQQDLAVRFNVSQDTVNRIIVTWSHFLYFQLGSLKIWPSRSQIDECMPQCFQEMYPSTRVILTCAEMKLQTSSSPSVNSEFGSNRKDASTVKGVVGIKPTGCPCFVSGLHDGSVSEREITKQCGIVDLLEAGDGVMADDGFVVQDLLSARGVTLNVPPFLSDSGRRFAADRDEETARLRVHVERAIRRVKEYHILDSLLPVSLVESATQLWTVSCLLSLFKGPLCDTES